MNVELLLEDLVELNAGEIDYPVSSSLDQTINYLQNLVSNPQDTNTQQSFAKSLGLLRNQLEDRFGNFDPRTIETLEEMRILWYFSPQLADEIHSSLSANGVTPAVALEFATNIQIERKSIVAALETAESSLTILGFEAEPIEEGRAEIGFQIPRDIFNNEFDDFIKELKIAKFIVDSASLLEKGEVSEIELGQISSSDPMLILGIDPKVIGAIGAFVTWALHTWKQAEEIRQIRIKTANLPELDDITATLDARVQELVSKRIEEHAAELVAAKKTKDDKELIGRLERTLRLVVERVERGYKVHLRLPAYDPDEEKVEEKYGNIDLYELRENLSFPEPPEKPILQLTKAEDNEVSKKDDK